MTAKASQCQFAHTTRPSRVQKNGCRAALKAYLRSKLIEFALLYDIEFHDNLIGCECGAHVVRHELFKAVGQGRGMCSIEQKRGYHHDRDARALEVTRISRWERRGTIGSSSLLIVWVRGRFLEGW